jgi:hypothetical protein
LNLTVCSPRSQTAFENYATAMLKAATGVTSLQLAITLDFIPTESLFDEERGLLPRRAGQTMSFHPSLLPNQQQCIEVFRRLKVLHAPLKTLDIIIKGRALDSDLYGWTGLASSSEIHQLLEAYVAENEDSAGTTPDSTISEVTAQTRYNDYSAQGAIAVANDVRNIQLSQFAWDEIPDYILDQPREKVGKSSTSGRSYGSYRTSQRT